MKPSLQLSIGQHLALTPQLQQAIRILQLSTLDLQLEIQQAVESNPMLEATAVEDKEEPLENNKNSQEEFPDVQWSQLYSNSTKNNSFEDSDFSQENRQGTTTNLQDHLRWQLDLTPMSDIDRVIAETIIDAMDDDGFLTQSIAEIYASLNSEAYPLDIEEIEAVKHRLQHFDPIGCAANNLTETLLAQLQQLPEHNEDIELAKRIIATDIELLGQHNYRQLLKNHHISEAELNRVLQVIQGLNPRPGSLIQQSNTEYVIPDVYVKKSEGSWQVFLNPNTLPKLSINTQYASLIQRADPSSDNQFLKNNLTEARWFLKSIQSRQDTLLKVARCIVDYQIDFLEQGEEAMKPLILNDIAQALDLHESTISRVTTQKFIHTPRGMFELKYFFSSHVNTKNGGECSSTAIRAVIKKLIAAENRSKPLSDSSIARMISEQGIHVARRTVAKYREALSIAPSNERKTISNQLYLE